MLEFLLAPVSWIYGAVVSLRNRLYDSGLIRSAAFDVPVVCVGNITVGGTGKTPMCELLIDHFRETHTVALLSRGYGRKTKGYLEVTAKSPYRNVGDEPKQIKLKFPETVVVVCEDRIYGIERLRREHPEVGIVIMDDGFQYRRLEPKLNILMVDYTRPIDKDRYLPLGRLRDQPKQKRRAHYVVVTKCPCDMSPIDRRIAKTRLDLLPFQSLIFTRPVGGAIYPAFPDDAGEDAILAGSPVVAMAALGNPTPFVDGLGARYDVVGKLLFPDHHPYAVRDLRKMEEALAGAPPKTIIITTEKDAVKLGGGKKIPASLRARIYVQPMRMMFIDSSRDDFFKTLDYDVRADQKNSFFNSR